MHENDLVARLTGTREETAIVWLSRAGESRTDNPPGFSDQDRYEVERSLVALGLINDEFSSAHEWETTGLGRRVAERLEGARTTGPIRRATVQKELMRWIYDDQPISTADFVGRTVDGIEVDERRTDEAIRFLRESGLLAGTPANQSAVVLRPRLTPLGIEAMDDPRPPIDFIRNGGTTIYDQSNNLHINGGNVGAAMAGNDGNQTGNLVTVGAASEIVGLISELREELGAIDDPALPAAVLTVLDEMESEATAVAPDASKFNSFYGSFMAALATKLADPAYAGIAELAAGLGNMVAVLGSGPVM